MDEDLNLKVLNISHTASLVFCNGANMIIISYWENEMIVRRPIIYDAGLLKKRGWKGGGDRISVPTHPRQVLVTTPQR